MINFLFLNILYLITTPYIKKRVSNEFTSSEYVVVTGVFFLYNLIIYFAYKYKFKKEKFDIVNKIRNGTKSKIFLDILGTSIFLI